MDALDIAVNFIKQPGIEGCNLVAYPDPASPLYAAMSKANILKSYMAGKINRPADMAGLSGNPWTCGWGETQGVKEGMVWTQEMADSKLIERVRGFQRDVLAVSPSLSTLSPYKLAAVTSLAYNIGIGNYRSSTVAKCIAVGDHKGAAEAILLWNKAGGKVLNGLVTRRKLEREMYLKG